jgi:hypothetical protein
MGSHEARKELKMQIDGLALTALGFLALILLTTVGFSIYFARLMGKKRGER